MKKTQVKRNVTLQDGTQVKEYVGQFPLPILTHCPHKWAMVDMENGNVYVINPEVNPQSTSKGIIRVPKDGRNKINQLLRSILGVR